MEIFTFILFVCVVWISCIPARESEIYDAEYEQIQAHPEERFSK